jgi:hypothetical protein
MLVAGLLAAFVALWFLAKPTLSTNATAEVTTAPTVKADPPTQSSSPAPAASQTTAAANPAPTQGTHHTSTVSLPTPVSWWKLNDGSGTTAADTMGINPASGTNTGWCASANCATFNGTDSAFTTAGPVLNTGPGNSFTVAAWVYMDEIKPNGLFATAVSQDGTGDSGFYLQYSGADKRWAFSRSARALSRTKPAVNKWTYLTGVFDASDDQLRLYVNGGLQGTSTDSAPSAADGSLAIGRAQYSGQPADWFPGAIDNVEAFNVALSSAQVKQLYSARSG